MIENLPAWIGPALGGGLAGFGTSMVTVGRWVYDAKSSADQALRLLQGSDEIDGDGIIEIVEENRTISRSNRRAIEQAESVPSPRKYE